MSVAWWVLGLYIVDRIWKTWLILSFSGQEESPQTWPSVTFLSPVTRGWCHLEANLKSRRDQDYPGEVQHLVILDTDDLDSQSLVPIEERVLAEPDGQEIASKPIKLLAGLPRATGDILVFVDDDIHLPPNALRHLVSALQRWGVGASFGIAYAPQRDNPATRLLSAFINGNAAFSYLTLASVMEPYTITGHIFAIPHDVFKKIGGLENMEGRLDDDHELARRLRKNGWTCRQTSLTYDLHNRLESLADYWEQMRRWFIIPKTTMSAELKPSEKALSGLVVAGSALPTMLLLCANPKALFVFVLFHLLSHEIVCRRVYGRPGDDRFYLLVSALLAPLQVLHAWLWSPTEFTWRGRFWRLS